MIKVISVLKQQAQNKQQLPETSRFKVWKYLAVGIGFGLNTFMGLFFFKINAFVPAITFMLTWNVMTIAMLIIAKFLRYISKFYKYIYLMIAIWPILSLTVYIGLGLLAIKWMSTW